MTKKEFEKKYADVIGMISAANNVDMSVALAQLISSIKGHFGMCYTAAGIKEVFEQYPGVPVNFDYDECFNDYIAMISK